MKKILALILALAMVLSLAACGKPAEQPPVETQPATPDTQPVETEPEVQEPQKNVDRYPLQSDKTFEVVSGSDIFGDDGETVITQAMQKATGVDIDWSFMTAEQVQLALTGKDLPDAIFQYASLLDKATMYEYGQGGYFVNFMDYLDIMPNFSAVIEANPNALKVVQNEDGSVYCLPTLTVTSTGFNNLLYYRTDMMKAAGWEKAPATTDEFIQFVTDLQAHYGANDPEFIAVNAYAANRMGWSTKRIMSYFFPAFGELLLTELTVDSQGNVVLGASTEQYKHLLEFMNELWNSGAFNTNIYSQEATASQALAAGDHVAIVTDHNGHTPEGYANMSVLAPLTSEYYTTQHWYKSPSCSWGRINAISAQCEDIETMVKWFDAWYAPATDPLNAEGTLYAITPWLGEIGVDHALDEATGIYTELEHEGIEMGKFLASESFQIALYSGYEGGLFPFSSAPTNGVGVKGQGTINNLWPYAETPFDLNSLVLTEDESDTYNDAWTDINAYIVESTAKFITGEADIAAEWDSYVEALEQMGLQDVIDVYQAAYDRAQ
ncbi:MAG: extracellular solute-binding protein [Oscillospiraceae bacterium]|nr:extracellular solute-binding protein [Oscillospiraceae bacterium]